MFREQSLVTLFTIQLVGNTLKYGFMITMLWTMIDNHHKARLMLHTYNIHQDSNTHSLLKLMRHHDAATIVFFECDKPWSAQIMQSGSC